MTRELSLSTTPTKNREPLFYYSLLGKEVRKKEGVFLIALIHKGAG